MCIFFFRQFHYRFRDLARSLHHLDLYIHIRLSPVRFFFPGFLLYDYYAHELQRTEYERLINTCKVIFKVSFSLFVCLFSCALSLIFFFQLASATTTIANFLDTVSDYFVNDAMNCLFAHSAAIVSIWYSSFKL